MFWTQMLGLFFFKHRKLSFSIFSFFLIFTIIPITNSNNVLFNIIISVADVF